MEAVKVTNCLGETREAELSPYMGDGAVSYNCPFCGGYAEPEPGCRNPMCEASPWAKADEVRAEREKREQRERERAAERERMDRWAAHQAEQRRQETTRRAVELGEVREAGQCVECYQRHYGKRIKHRNTCPHQARREERALVSA